MKSDTPPREKILAEGKRLRLLETGGWEFVRRKGSAGVVAIVAVTDDNRLLLVEQFRPPVGRQVISLPAGLVGDDGDANEQSLIAARRELLEETGYDSEKLTLLAEGPSSPGLTDETIQMVFAEKLTKLNDGGGVPGEGITVHAIPTGELETWLATRAAEGIAIDLKLYAGLHFLARPRK